MKSSSNPFIAVMFHGFFQGFAALLDRMGAQIRLEKELRFIVSVPTDFLRPLIVEAAAKPMWSKRCGLTIQNEDLIIVLGQQSE